MQNPYADELGTTPGKKCSTCVHFRRKPEHAAPECDIAGGEVNVRMEACGEWRGVLSAVGTRAPIMPPSPGTQISLL